MSSLGGPSIVTSGLVLHLDAANVKSFKGEPTVNVTTGTMTPYTPYNTMTRNGQNFTFTMVGGSALYLTVTNGTDYNGQTLSLSGYMFKNGLPHALTNGYSRANTYHTVTAPKWYFDSVTGYFEIIETCNASSLWLFHTPSGAVGGDIITINNFQVEVKGYVTPFVNGTRGTTVATGGGFADRSGNSNHGEVINGPTYNSLKGGSIVFDGVDDYVNFTSNIDFADSVEFSVETVISIPTFVQTLSRVHWLSGSGGNSMMMFRASDFYMWNEAGGINGLQISYTFNINTIYHVIVTRNVSNNVSLYVNGVFINSGSRSGQFKWYTMGRLGSSTTYCSKFTSYFNRVYNRALSTTEVLQNYNATKSRFI